MKRLIFTALALVLVVWTSPAMLAFCGFYVAQANGKLFNQASQVVLVRDDNRTVMTMANDFKGDAKQFAVVIPVPTAIRQDQIRVADPALLGRIDEYSAPRLVEYFDANPCDLPTTRDALSAGRGGGGGRGGGAAPAPASSLGVTIEARYTVGEYDILILSALECNGLETWLKDNKYQIPAGAANVLSSYIRQNMKFFVAKVNLAEQSRLGFVSLRPIQIEFETPKFMLPIRLGMINADGPQDLIVFALSRKGRVETTNYRTVRLPTGMDIPLFVKEKFADFYKALFSDQVRRENMSAVFTEYVWNMSSCDPCSTNPLTIDELRKLGAYGSDNTPPSPRNPVTLTRMHLRYDNPHFPEDLVFQETADRGNYQARYVLRHPWNGTDTCQAASLYHDQLPDRYNREAQTLSGLTGWTIADIHRQMGR